ncbi:MAG TPA: hypothetical protein VN892_17605 [Solirubrobacteraceae bacterium]|nr:hypothetical protein [Solirubrobacteraceae bacterium]
MDGIPGRAFAASQWADRPHLPQSLTARQRTLHERLCSQDAKLGATLGAMYVGAITVLESDSPDRVSQAAHSCRELIEKLVRTRAEPAKPGVGNPRDRSSELEREWTAYSASVGVGAAGLDGRTVDRGLTTVLIRVEAYCESARSHKPGRQDQAARALAQLGLTDAALPEEVRDEDIKQLIGLWKFFEKAAHHSTAHCVPERVRAEFAVLEDLLMRWVPEIFADLDELDSLIGGHGA